MLISLPRVSDSLGTLVDVLSQVNDGEGIVANPTNGVINPVSAGEGEGAGGDSGRPKNNPSNLNKHFCLIF